MMPAHGLHTAAGVSREAGAGAGGRDGRLVLVRVRRLHLFAVCHPGHAAS